MGDVTRLTYQRRTPRSSRRALRPYVDRADIAYLDEPIPSSVRFDDGLEGQQGHLTGY